MKRAFFTLAPLLLAGGASAGGCGSRAGLGVPGAGDAAVAESTDAAAFDSGPAEAAGDAPWTDTTSCHALVLWFVGCDEERLHECLREYDAVSASTRQTVDAAAACLAYDLHSPGAQAPGLPTWPAASATCTPAALPPLLDANDQWFHGGCQQYNGAAVQAMSMAPGFPACGADAGEPDCFFGWGSTATL